MASNTVGFVFADSTFFNWILSDTQLENLKGEHGNWYAGVLAKELAEKNNVQTSCNLSRIVLGGVEQPLPGPRKTNETTEERNHWSKNEVLLLIEVYRKHRNDFNTSRKKMDVWKSISDEMSCHGMDKDHSICEKKFSNLKQRYKSINDHNNRTGRDLKTWAYFQEMDSLFSKDPAIKPTMTLSSLGETRGCSISCETAATATATTTVQVPKRKLFVSPDRQTTPEKGLNVHVASNEIKRKKLKKNESEPTAPSWFKDWSEKSNKIMQGILEETRRKNDLLEKLIEKL